MSPARRRLEQQAGSSVTGLLDELPVVLKPDLQDPDGMQVYTIYAYNYPAQSAYVAFPSMWYSRRPDDFDRVDPGAHRHSGDPIHLFTGRDRLAAALPATPDLAGFARVGLGAPDLRGRTWSRAETNSTSTTTACPREHMTMDKSADWTCVTARAIFRLDGFVSADAAYEGGEFTTPILTFTGSRLQYNAKTGGGGFIRTEILDSAGTSHPRIHRGRIAPGQWQQRPSPGLLEGIRRCLLPGRTAGAPAAGDAGREALRPPVRPLIEHGAPQNHATTGGASFLAPSFERWVKSLVGGWTSWFFFSKGGRSFRSFSRSVGVMTNTGGSRRCGRSVFLECEVVRRRRGRRRSGRRRSFTCNMHTPRRGGRCHAGAGRVTTHKGRPYVYFRHSTPARIAHLGA